MELEGDRDGVGPRQRGKTMRKTTRELLPCPTYTPFSHDQLVLIRQNLSQAIHDNPALVTLFMGQAPPTTPRTAPTPGPLRNPQANPPHCCRNPCTMPMSTCHPQQAINSIPSMNEP